MQFKKSTRFPEKFCEIADFRDERFNLTYELNFFFEMRSAVVPESACTVPVFRLFM